MTERMLTVLTVLAARGVLTPNELAYALGFTRGQDANRHSKNGRTMAPAQRVIFPLTALRRLGLVSMTNRRDGRSGTAYVITVEGVRFLRGRKR